MKPIVRFVASASALAFASTLGMALAAAVEPVQIGTRAGEDDLILPTRRRPGVSVFTAPPLPPAANRIAPLTLEVVVRRRASERSTTVRQVISRTNQRVHMRLSEDREWLFEQNPVDGRRVTGMLVVHSQRTIVLYEESALRNWLRLDGWYPVLTLGLNAGDLAALHPSGSRMAAGYRFVKMKTRGSTTGVSEAWWCDEQVLPLYYTTSESGAVTTISVERIRSGVDTDLLRSAQTRFPTYRMVDLAEWLEEH